MKDGRTEARSLSLSLLSLVASTPEEKRGPRDNIALQLRERIKKTAVRGLVVLTGMVGGRARRQLGESPPSPLEVEAALPIASPPAIRCRQGWSEPSYSVVLHGNYSFLNRLAF